MSETKVKLAESGFGAQFFVFSFASVYDWLKFAAEYAPLQSSYVPGARVADPASSEP